MFKFVQSNSVIFVYFILKLDDGLMVEFICNNGKLVLFCFGDILFFEGLEQQFLGLKEGEKKVFLLEFDVVFGVFSLDLIQYFLCCEFMVVGELEVGVIMFFIVMDGSEMSGVICEINGDLIIVDFNYLLVGYIVYFDIEVLEIDLVLEV